MLLQGSQAATSSSSQRTELVPGNIPRIVLKREDVATSSNIINNVCVICNTRGSALSGNLIIEQSYIDIVLQNV